MDEITQIALQVPEPLVEISENGLATFKRAEQGRGFVKAVHNTVNNSLKELTGYSKENRPDEHTRTPFEFGDITGRVESTPKSSTSYKTALDEITNYLKHEQTRGTKTLNAGELVSRVYVWLKDATNPTLEQKIYFDNEEEILAEAGVTEEPPEATTFYADTSNYSTLNKGTILDRFKAKRIDEYLSSEIIRPFDRLIKETALDRLGLDAENLQETARTTLSQDNRAFNVKVISRPSTAYAAILKAMFGDKVARSTGRSGEVYSLIDERVSDTSDLTELFEVKRRATGIYVSLEKVRDRLEALTEGHTTTKTRLEWEYNPVLEFAAIAN